METKYLLKPSAFSSVELGDFLVVEEHNVG